MVSLTLHTATISTLLPVTTSALRTNIGIVLTLRDYLSDLPDAAALDYATYAEWHTLVVTEHSLMNRKTIRTRARISLSTAAWICQHCYYPVAQAITPIVARSTMEQTKFDSDVKSHSLPACSIYVPGILRVGK
jgi:hypothetical protein